VPIASSAQGEAEAMSEVSLEGYSPMDPSRQQDPFPYYAALRREAPVFQGSGGIYFVSGHAAVLEVLGQPNRFSSQWGNTMGPPPVEGVEEEMKAIVADGYPPVSTMLTLDPPLQTRYRKSVGRAFSTRRVESLEPGIRKVAIDLIEAWPRTGPIDFMRQLSIPFPVRVIAQLLSVPAERESDVKRWSDDSVASIGVKISPERALEAARSVVEMQRYVGTLIEERQKNSRDDFLSEMIAADFEDLEGNVRKLEIPEMVSIVQQIMVAGNEATTKGITEILAPHVEPR